MRTFFYDTSSLLISANNLFEDNPEGKIVFSTITLKELEHIKTSFHKDIEIKYAAHTLLKNLEKHKDSYNIYLYKPSFLDNIHDFDINDDIRILASAIDYQKNNPEEEVYFICNDLELKAFASLFFLDHVISIASKDKYNGFKEITVNSQQLEDFYSNRDKNLFNLKINEYLILDLDETIESDQNEKHQIAYCWDGKHMRDIHFNDWKSEQFGKVRPMKNDIYQRLAMDSMDHNQITMIKGPAGSGKTYLSLGYLFYKLEHHQIDKIIIFCNTVATKNSARLGYLPGTKDEKLLDSQIGNLLASKFGGSRMAVERMIDENKLVLLPMSDIRGYDTSNLNAGIYITEAQNLDIELLKLALQRIGSDSICIIDGDCEAQVDDIAFSGNSNGMRRASKVFRGHDIYGEVELQQIHRSKIAEIAENM